MHFVYSRPVQLMWHQMVVGSYGWVFKLLCELCFVGCHCSQQSAKPVCMLSTDSCCEGLCECHWASRLRCWLVGIRRLLARRVSCQLVCVQKLFTADSIAKCQVHTGCNVLTVHYCNTVEVCVLLCLCSCWYSEWSHRHANWCCWTAWRLLWFCGQTTVSHFRSLVRTWGSTKPTCCCVQCNCSTDMLLCAV
jgi:hypothetical protein